MSKFDWQDEQDEDGEAGSSGGKTGEVHFRYRDAMSISPREDMQSEEQKRLLLVEGDLSFEEIKKAKAKIEYYKAIKSGMSKTAAAHKTGYAPGVAAGNENVLEHPRHKGKPHGEPQVDFRIEQNKAETNEKARDRLENRLRLTHQPKFNPRPSPTR